MYPPGIPFSANPRFYSANGQGFTIPYLQTKPALWQIPFPATAARFFSLKKSFMRIQNHVLLLLLLLQQVAFGQQPDPKKTDNLSPDILLMEGAPPPTKVLLLGSFHFGYPNLDGHKVDSSRMIDVLSPQRQKEMRALLDVVARFRPTRIYLESRNPRFTDSLYAAYRDGKHVLRRNEIDQIGYRLAKELGHSKVYAVDATTLAGDLQPRLPLIDSLWNDSPPVDAARDARWNKAYAKLYTTGDSLELHHTLLETFLLMAEPQVLRRMHGHYLVGGFNTQNNNGPDRLAVWWYSRNLRIFNNILKTRPGPEDRILVLFGNGHMSILKHLFESSPEFEPVPLRSLLKE